MSLFQTRKTTAFIAIHCSATRPSLDVTMAMVRGWHRARNFIAEGYHYLIRRDGTLEVGRPEGVIGAHVENFNHNSIGICLAGGVAEDFTPHKPGTPWRGDGAENNFTEAQFKTLAKLLIELKARYPKAVIQGHRDFPNVRKSCPCFDVRQWMAEQGDEPKAATAVAQTFTVTKKHSTYWAISRHLNVDVHDLMELNADTPPLALRIGDVLKVPT